MDYRLLLVLLVSTASVAAYLLYLLMDMRAKFHHGVWLGFPAGTETKGYSRYRDSNGDVKGIEFEMSLGKSASAVIHYSKDDYKILEH